MSEKSRAEILVDRIVEALSIEYHVAVLVAGYQIAEPVVAASFENGIVTLQAEGQLTLHVASEALVGVAVSAPVD